MDDETIQTSTANLKLFYMENNHSELPDGSNVFHIILLAPSLSFNFFMQQHICNSINNCLYNNNEDESIYICFGFLDYDAICLGIKVSKKMLNLHN